MKKGDIVDGVVERMDFPNKGIVRIDTEEEETYAVVKNALPGQRISLRISKKKHGNIEGRLLDVVEESPYCGETGCPHAGVCGGCLYQGMSYEKQLIIKDGQIRRLLSPVIGEEAYTAADEGILPSPSSEGYRNKMELTFGDDEPGGRLMLGMHVRGSFYDIITTDECRIMDEDMRTVLRVTLQYFRERGVTYYHKRTHKGYLRHLLLRKAARTGELLVCLVTSSDVLQRRATAEQNASERDAEEQNAEDRNLTGLKTADLNTAYLNAADRNAEEQNAEDRNLTGLKTANLNTADRNAADPNTEEEDLLSGWKEALLAAEYDGKLAGILHTRNDRPADVVEDQGTTVLYGQGYFTEELLGLQFRITPFSFFQTNSLGAEVLYEKAREYILRAGKEDNGTAALRGQQNRLGCVYDLYSGTGTIAQILSPAADEVIGVEIVEEAVEAAKENAAGNGLANCRFLCGDVLKVIDGIAEKPDMIVLDPPRDGIHPKALPKLIAYGVERILYISCKPTSLARDLPAFLSAGYRVERLCKVDMFPMTGGVETVCLLSNRKPDARVKIDVDLEDYYRIKDEQKKNKASE